MRRLIYNEPGNHRVYTDELEGCYLRDRSDEEVEVDLTMPILIQQDHRDGYSERAFVRLTEGYSASPSMATVLFLMTHFNMQVRVMTNALDSDGDRAGPMHDLRSYTIDAGVEDELDDFVEVFSPSEEGGIAWKPIKRESVFHWTEGNVSCRANYSGNDQWVIVQISSFGEEWTSVVPTAAMVRAMSAHADRQRSAYAERVRS